MKAIKFYTKTLLFFVLILVVSAGCESTTMITSVPPTAKVYIEGQYAGETPYAYTDDKIIFSKTDIKITKEGYDDLYTTLTRDEEPCSEAIVGGIFLFWPLLLWGLEYQTEHFYELTPLANPSLYEDNQGHPKSKADQLRELKKLLDDGIINQEEYEKEKVKILDKSE